MDPVIESFSHLLVVDLEATCFEPPDPPIPKDEMETIEIGAVLVDRETLAPCGELQSFVRPVRHPRITRFCTELTTIRQADVDGAPLFPDVMRALGRFLGERKALFCSWGFYDQRQLAQDAAYHGISLPLSREHLNLKKRFGERFGGKKTGMAGALARVGLTLSGTHHRGIDDARNIARLLPWIVGDAQAPPRCGIVPE
jgi:inhibitor of KinA sporulation pathway (predicted exonuclease)